MFVDQFDSPKAFQLVIEALLDRGDRVASMALMLQWISQVERTRLEDGDVSFHPLALRWLRAVEEFEHETGEDQWPLVVRFFARLEASAEEYWHVPAFELSREGRRNGLVDPVNSEDAVSLSEGNETDSFLDDDNRVYSAAYEDMIYRDSTDDGQDSPVMDEGSMGGEFELEAESQRLGQRLEFLATVARLWRHAAIAWDSDSAAGQERREQFAAWCNHAATQYDRLADLLEKVHLYRIPQPSGSHDSMVEFDRQRLVKESLLEQIMSACVEWAGAGRLLCAAGYVREGFGRDEERDSASISVLQAVLTGNIAGVREQWNEFTSWLSKQELLYVPMARGGKPRRIVRARAMGHLLQDLLEWLPRLGLIRETRDLLDLAQSMETEHQVGSGAVTEYDRLFASGYRAMVQCLVASAKTWEMGRGVGVEFATLLPVQDANLSDSMLVEALKELTESEIRRWLTHSRTLRLSVVERLLIEEDWNAFVRFIERYGADLFTQKFMNLGNLRAILHQRVAVWLSNLELDPETEELRLVREMGTHVSREDAAKWLTIALEAIVENYREYRDYNTTTTHSDHGDMLYTLIDFLRLRVAYDRVAWQLRPVVIAHEVLVRNNRPAAAEMWQQALAERTAETADANIAQFEALCEKYGIRLPTVAERLAERFTRPLAIDRVQALVPPAIAAAGTEDRAPFEVLAQEVASLAQEPAGAGLDLPDWLEALEEEVSLVRCKRRHRHPSDNVLRRIEQAKLSWEDWQRQLGQG
jgi:hypothetical protein